MPAKRATNAPLGDAKLDGVRILVLDDDADFGAAVAIVLRAAGSVVEALTDATAALARVRTFRPDVLVTDLSMPGADGVAVMAAAHAIDARLGVVIMTGVGGVPDAVRAMRAGAEHFLTKPVDARALLGAIEAVVRRRRARDLGETGARDDGARPLVGESVPMCALRAKIARVAPHLSTVLLLGETGTGKERVAEALHAGSARAARPFVRINCGAFAETLLESELFGHEKGAFTGALTRREGRFRLAQGGTLLLDEIGEVSPTVQIKLLRVLQERTFERVGGNETLTADVRIVAATHRDLPALIEAGRFRADLYYRLNVVRLELPPLRACGTDVLLLAEFFMGRTAARLGLAPKTLGADAKRVLMQHAWPGNVRELENALESAMVMAPRDEITADDLASSLIGHAFGEATAVEGTTLAAMERHALLTTYEAVGHSAKRTAEILGMSVRTVHYRLSSYGRTAH